MKSLLNQRLRGGLAAAIALATLASTTLQAQTLVNRYQFGGNVEDSVGTQDGAASTANTFTEAPLFGSIVPPGATGPTQSIEFGMNQGSLKSFFTLSDTVLEDQATAGSVSMFLRPDSVAGADLRYAFLGAATSNFFIGQVASGTDQVLRARAGAGVVGNQVITVGDWYHVALTWEVIGSNLSRSFYVNGTLVDSGTVAGGIGDIGQVRVGTFNALNSSTGLVNQFDGRMYDLQVYGGVLSAGQIASLANNPGTFAAVPEPTSVALLTAGAVVTFAFLRRRRKES